MISIYINFIFGIGGPKFQFFCHVKILNFCIYKSKQMNLCRFTNSDFCHNPKKKFYFFHFFKMIF